MMLLPPLIRLHYLEKGTSILACIQMESHGDDINEISRLASVGKQPILMAAFQILLDINNGQASFRYSSPTICEP
jgi:hypothetical protein